jgi:hypothetical protein
MPHPSSTLAARLSAQLLAGPPARDPVAVAERLLAVQGQDPRGFRLAVRARSEGLHASDVDRALTEERSLLVTWLNRGTLHLVRSEDYPLLQAVTTPPLRTGSARRLAQEGVPPDDAERGIEAIERSIATDGPLTAEQLRARVREAGVRADGQALYHLLYRASLDGLIVRGPMAGKKHAYVLVRDWLGKPRRVDGDKALPELARRYLAGHGPATDRDLARWAGIPLGQARTGLSWISTELKDIGDGIVDLKKRGPAAELPPPRLLGSYDPVLLGWTSREELLGKHQYLVTVNGLFRPFAMVKGRAVGTWSMPKGKVVLEKLARISKADREALERDAEDVTCFLG